MPTRLRVTLLSTRTSYEQYVTALRGINDERKKTPNYNEKGLENLSNAIILQAVKDYRKALKGFSLNGKSSTAVIAECERFFRSEWFRVLTNVDGEYLIINIRKEYGL